MKQAFFYLILFSYTCHFGQKERGKFTALSVLPAVEFYENKGQWPSEVLFKAEKEGGKWWIMKDRMWYHMQDLSAMNHAHDALNSTQDPTIKQHIIEVKFLNAQPFEGCDVQGKTKHYQNYFIGKDSSRWASDVHGYTRVVRKALYPGIDLTFVNGKQIGRAQV